MEKSDSKEEAKACACEETRKELTPPAGNYDGAEGILRFPIPTCRDEFLLAFHAGDFYGVLREFDQWLRGAIKYGHDDDGLDVLQGARNRLHELLEDHNVNLEMVE